MHHEGLWTLSTESLITALPPARESTCGARRLVRLVLSELPVV
jgi:hypothetical protein